MTPKLLAMLELTDKKTENKITLMFSDVDFESEVLTDTAQQRVHSLINYSFQLERPDPKQLDLFATQSNKDFVELLRAEYNSLNFAAYYCDAFGGSLD